MTINILEWQESFMHLPKLMEENAFYLKAKGDFGGALWAYANEYRASTKKGASFVSEVCFEQMFDVCLLSYVKNGRNFQTKEQLLGEIRGELVQVLRSQQEGGKFNEFFNSCKRKLFPRGRGETPFSVDPRLLIASEAKSRR